MIPVEDAVHYYSRRQRMALAMAEATADPPVRNIRLEIARLYAKLAGESHDASIAVLGPSAELMPEQLVMSISTVMKPQHKAFVGRIGCAGTTQVTRRPDVTSIGIIGSSSQFPCNSNEGCTT